MNKHNKTKKGGFRVGRLANPLRRDEYGSICSLQDTEKANCGPLVLFMMGIITESEYNQYAIECVPGFGTLPSKILGIVNGKRSTPCYWAHLKLDTASEATLSPYFDYMAKGLGENPYYTIVLLFNSDNPSGHYYILKYTSGSIMMINTYECGSRGINEIPFDATIYSSYGRTDILIMQEHNVPPLSSGKSLDISNTQALEASIMSGASSRPRGMGSSSEYGTMTSRPPAPPPTPRYGTTGTGYVAPISTGYGVPTGYGAPAPAPAPRYGTTGTGYGSSTGYSTGYGQHSSGQGRENFVTPWGGNRKTNKRKKSSKTKRNKRR